MSVCEVERSCCKASPLLLFPFPLFLLREMAGDEMSIHLRVSGPQFAQLTTSVPLQNVQLSLSTRNKQGQRSGQRGETAGGDLLKKRCWETSRL